MAACQLYGLISDQQYCCTVSKDASLGVMQWRNSGPNYYSAIRLRYYLLSPFLKHPEHLAICLSAFNVLPNRLTVGNWLASADRGH